MNLTKKYLRYETQVIVKLGFGEQPFPSVTLCNLNVIRKSQLNQTTEELQSFLVSYIFKTIIFVSNNKVIAL